MAGGEIKRPVSIGDWPGSEIDDAVLGRRIGEIKWGLFDVVIILGPWAQLIKEDLGISPRVISESD